jgi:hypothetical protein
VAKKDSYPFEVNALSFAKGYGELHALFISQRSDWIVFQISATCAVGAMGIKLWQNPPQNAMQMGKISRCLRLMHLPDETAHF